MNEKVKAALIAVAIVVAVVLLFFFVLIPYINRNYRIGSFGPGGTCGTYGPDFRTAKGTTKGENGQDFEIWCCCNHKKNICLEDDEDCVILSKKEIGEKNE